MATHVMCNLYNVTTTHEAIIAWVRAMRDVAGNMPTPPKFLTGKADRGASAFDLET